MGSSENRGSGSGGCFSGFLRVVFCRSKLQTHPAGESPEMTTELLTKELEKEEITSLKPASTVAAPGVVARLMGLESFPLDSEWMRSEGRHRILDASVRRCRSVNFMEYLLEFDISKNSPRDESHHRRVKTSVSFREVPLLRPQRDKDLLVLYLKDQVKTVTNELPGTAVKPKVAGKESSHTNEKNKNSRRNDTSKGPEVHDEPRKPARKEITSSNGNSCVRKRRRPVQKTKGKRTMSKPVKEKELLEESKFMKKIKKKTSFQEEVESVFSPEGCSPVSVLDNTAVNSPVHDGQILFTDDSEAASLCSKTIAGGCRKDKRRVNAEEHYIQLFIHLRKLTDDEAKEANWGMKRGLEDMFSDLEEVLLNHLVSEMVQELGQSSMAAT